MKRRFAFLVIALATHLGVGLLSRAWTLRSQSADLAAARASLDVERAQTTEAIRVLAQAVVDADTRVFAAQAETVATTAVHAKAQARSRAVASAPVPVTPGELREAAEGLGWAP